MFKMETIVIETEYNVLNTTNTRIYTSVNFDSIPDELKKDDQWVLWKLEPNDTGKMTKVPYNKNGFKAKSNDSSTWMTFEDAYAAYIQSPEEYSGLGFMFSESDEFIGFDLDDVRNPITGEFNPGILDEIMSLESYAEISQSGEGVHVIAIGKVPGPRRRNNGREMYDSGQFFVVTGNHISGTPLTINEAPEEAILEIYSKIDSSSTKDTEELSPRLRDKAVIEKCENAANGKLFEQLYNGDWRAVGRYPSQSEADLALCNLLAAQTRDPKQIGRIFSGSGLYRDKWDRDDYKDWTISKALEDVKPMGTNPRDKYFEGSRFVVKSLADEILEEEYFITLADTGELYHYDEGVYRLGGENLIKSIAQEKLGHQFRRNSIAEVLDYIKIETSADRSSINRESHIINLNNGLYDLRTDEFKPHSPAILSTIRIPVGYNPEAKCPNIDKFLSEVVSPEDKQLLIEWAGYCLIPDNRIQKAVMLIGNGSNGKSVFLELLTQFIGEQNASSESLQDLDSNRFSAANLYGKLINVHPDLSRMKISEGSMFRNLCGGDRIRAERKFEGAFNFENTARLIFAANNLPPAKYIDYAFCRRWILIDFPNTFEGENVDIQLIDKLTTPSELSGLLNLALAALKSLRVSGKFSYDKSVDDVMRMYQINSNSVAAFVDECVEFGDEDTSKRALYDAYQEWCQTNDIKPVAENIFGKGLKELEFADYRDTTGNRRYYWAGVSIVSME